MIPYHLTHLALPTPTSSHILQTLLHSSFPLSSRRYSSPLLPESNLRHQAPSHARCWSIHDVREAYTQMPFSTTSPSSTTTAPSPAPRILSTVAMNKPETSTRASGLFKVSSFKNSKRASMSSKLLKPFRLKELQGLILSSFGGAQGL